MKRIITLLSISLILLSFSACTSDEPYVPDCHTEEETITEPEANYYIKYLAQGNRNAGWIKSITVNTESGGKNYYQTNEFMERNLWSCPQRISSQY